MATSDTKEAAKERMNTRVAILVTLLLCFHGVAEVKAGNNMQAMQRISASRVVDAGQLAAMRTRQEMVDLMLTRARLGVSVTSVSARDAFEAELAAEQQRVAEREARLAAKVARDEAEYTRRDFHDDQFDLSQAALTLAVALLAVAALVSSQLLFVVSLIPALLGFVMGIAGLTGGRLHPQTLVGWLS